MFRSILLVCFLIFSSGAIGQNHEPGSTANQAISRLETDIRTLACDSFLGREAGLSDRPARDYLLGQFRAAGLKPLFPGKSFIQEFSFPGPDSNLRTTCNLGACIDNHAKFTVLVSAHYDHIGRGGKYSRSAGSHQVHNGADDNASGVAAMLELARRLKKAPARHFNYAFVAFSAHEEGLYGSSFFISHLPFELKTVDYLLNLDMVGRMDTSTRMVIVNGIATSPVLDSMIRVLGPVGFHIKTRETEIDGSDQRWFHRAGIPVLLFSTGIHEDYHKVTDDADRINYMGLALIVQYLESLILKLDALPKVPAATL